MSSGRSDESDRTTQKGDNEAHDRTESLRLSLYACFKQICPHGISTCTVLHDIRFIQPCSVWRLLRPTLTLEAFKTRASRAHIFLQLGGHVEATCIWKQLDFRIGRLLSVCLPRMPWPQPQFTQTISMTGRERGLLQRITCRYSWQHRDQ